MLLKPHNLLCQNGEISNYIFPISKLCGPYFSNVNIIIFPFFSVSIIRALVSFTKKKRFFLILNWAFTNEMKISEETKNSKSKTISPKLNK